MSRGALSACNEVTSQHILIIGLHELSKCFVKNSWGQSDEMLHKNSETIGGISRIRPYLTFQSFLEECWLQFKLGLL